MQSFEPNNEQCWIAGNLTIDTQAGVTVDTLSFHNTINEINVKVIRDNVHISLSGLFFFFSVFFNAFAELLHQQAGLVITWLCTGKSRVYSTF